MGINENLRFSFCKFVEKPTPSTSNHHEPIETKQHAGKAKQTEEPKPINENFDSLWKDELENVQPPNINRSNPSSFYGVSDLSTHSSASSASIDPIQRRMMEPSSGDEATIDEIPELLNDLHCGDILPARVSDTNNPLKFWIHIRQEKYVTQINDMLHQMR